jgi:hypothetical protein
MELRTVGEITEESTEEYSEIRNFGRGCKPHSPCRICYRTEVRGILSHAPYARYYLLFKTPITHFG